MAVIEHIPGIPNLFNAAMVILREIDLLLRCLVRPDPLIHIADDRSPERKWPERRGCSRIAQLMLPDGGIQQIIGITFSPNRRSLKILMPLISAPCALLYARQNKMRLPADRQHIALKHRQHSAAVPVKQRLRLRTEAAIEIDLAVFKQDRRVKHRLVLRTLTQDTAFLIPDISVELISPCGSIADRHRHKRRRIQHIVQIVAPVRTLTDIRRIQALIPVCIARIIRTGIDDTLAAPVSQVTRRCRIAHIVIEAERVPVKTVMGTVQIHAVPKYMRFTVRDILPGRKIGIESLFTGHNMNLPECRTASHLLSLSCIRESMSSSLLRS